MNEQFVLIYLAQGAEFDPRDEADVDEGPDAA